MTKSTIRVAIIGGGLGGTVLMNSLMKYDHIDAHIYEAKDTFKERGASVGLAGNAQRALRMMGLASTMEKTGAVPVNGAKALMGEGPDQGKLVIHKAGDLLTVLRPALLRELVDPIPDERMHVNKKLVKIDGDTIYFDDGSVVAADVIIGADGIHSSVRQYVLKDEPESVDPVHAGIFDCRAILPFEDALAKLGPDILHPEEPRQTIYMGDGSIIFFDHIETGKVLCIVAAGMIPDGWDKKKWKQSVSREWLLDRYQTWPPYARDLINLLCGDQKETSVFIEWESAPATKIYNGTMCLMGDAAHATTPWQGAGLGQACEDALIIQAALGACNSVQDVPQAFKTYDQLMRPRGRRVIESSRNMAMLLFGKEGLQAEKLCDKMTPMWDFIHDWDTERAMNDVVTAVRASSNGVAVA